jgi:hypothetical protein
MYYGQWKNGAAHGKGTSVNSKGDYFIGDWVKGARDGPGLWTEETGKVHRGSWVKNKLKGMGTALSNPALNNQALRIS